MDIDKKIEEFDNTFWLELIKYDSELAKRVRYWLKQKLTEAKREGQKEAYKDAGMVAFENYLVNKVTEYCKQKLKKLEGE